MINKVVLVGRITKDAEVKKTQSGLSVCNFSLALNKKDTAEYYDCVAWNKTAEILGYCKKGDIVGVDGHLKTRTYERDGNRIKAVEVEADRIQRIYGKKVELDPFTEMPLRTPEIGPEELPF